MSCAGIVMGCTLAIRESADLKPLNFAAKRKKKMFPPCPTPPHIIPRVSSLGPGRSHWPLLCDWINPKAWDNGHVTATGGMWQEDNQPTAVPFQSAWQWSLRHRQNTLLPSLCSMLEMRISISIGADVAGKLTQSSVWMFPFSFCS